MSDIAACIAGSFISAANVFIMPSFASGFMFFNFDAACFAFFGSIRGMPAPPGIGAIIASTCSSVKFSIISRKPEATRRLEDPSAPSSVILPRISSVPSYLGPQIFLCTFQSLC